jgi:hypothetical protein
MEPSYSVKIQAVSHFEVWRKAMLVSSLQSLTVGTGFCWNQQDNNEQSSIRAMDF